MSARPRQGGFTLLELLVAVAMLALLLGLLFAVLRTSLRTWESAERFIERSEASPQVPALLTRLIQGAVPVEAPEEDSRAGAPHRGARPLFRGDTTSVLLVAPGIDALPRRGLYVYRIFLAPDEADRPALWAQLRPYRPDELGPAPEPRLVLAEMGRFAVRYYGTGEDEDEPRWHEGWTPDNGTLPRLVGIEVQTEEGGPVQRLAAAPLLRAGARP